ncbi:MAG: hypothetical protein HY901_38650 [Deltaproteobacteria bacterium]|nr:hypothetical protein [Deltaproteobacteria bacterium]
MTREEWLPQGAAAMELIHRSDFRVASYHVGPRGEVPPWALMGFFEHAAGEHAASWKLSVMDLLPRGLSWVLSRYHLQLLRPLCYGEGVEVSTWPSGRSTMFATRDFEAVGTDGRPVALATTSWVLIDVRQKKPVPVAEVVPETFALERRSLADSFSALPKLEAHAAAPPVELPVMRRDLDLNEHVNHTVYVQWALEAVASEMLPGLRPVAIEVSYRAEARRGDRIRSLASGPQQAGERRVMLHQIAHCAEGSELARLRTTWGR